MHKANSIHTLPTLFFVFLGVNKIRPPQYKRAGVKLQRRRRWRRRSFWWPPPCRSYPLQSPCQPVWGGGLATGPKETRWGPGIISSSLWSPVNRPTSSRSSQGRAQWKTYRIWVHIKGMSSLFRSHNTEERTIRKWNIALYSHLQI